MDQEIQVYLLFNEVFKATKGIYRRAPLISGYILIAKLIKLYRDILSNRKIDGKVKRIVKKEFGKYIEEIAKAVSGRTRPENGERAIRELKKKIRNRLIEYVKKETRESI